MSASSERWLSVDEIAKHLGIASITVYRWLEKQKIPAHRIGRLWKFKVSEVDDWVCKGLAGKSPAEVGNRPKRIRNGLNQLTN